MKVFQNKRLGIICSKKQGFQYPKRLRLYSLIRTENNPKFKQGPKKGLSPHFGVLLYFEEQFLDYRSKADGIVILKYK